MILRTKLLPRIYRAILLSLMSGMIATINTRDATAQAQPTFIIEISLGDENQCYYEIQDRDGTRLSEQDLLPVTPGDKVNFKSTNVEVAIEVTKNESSTFPDQGTSLRGFAGGRKKNSFDLASGAEKTVNARANNGNGKSRHKVGISCVSGDVEIRSDTYPSGPNIDEIDSIILIPAVPLPDPSITIPDPDGNYNHIPDLKKHRPTPWRGPGGPVMEVDEDG